MADTDQHDGVARFAQIFVVVALAAMLLGAVLILAARETAVVDVPPGEQQTLLVHEVPDWTLFWHDIEVTVLSPGNFTVGPDPEGVDDEVVLRIRETTSGRTVTEDGNGTLRLGQAIWETDAQPGERWVVEVDNLGNRTARVSAIVTSVGGYALGGVFVVIGILGFVSYRIGIRHSRD